MCIINLCFLVNLLGRSHGAIPDQTMALVGLCVCKQCPRGEVMNKKIRHLRESYWKGLGKKQAQLPTSDVPKSVIHSTALKTFWRKGSNNPDWYHASLDQLQPVSKRSAPLFSRSNPDRLDMLLKNWRHVDPGHRQQLEIVPSSTKAIFSTIKETTGPSPQACKYLKSKDGSSISDSTEKMSRWIEHYSELYAGTSTVNSDSL